MRKNHTVAIILLMLLVESSFTISPILLGNSKVLHFRRETSCNISHSLVTKNVLSSSTNEKSSKLRISSVQDNTEQFTIYYLIHATDIHYGSAGIDINYYYSFRDQIYNVYRNAPLKPLAVIISGDLVDSPLVGYDFWEQVKQDLNLTDYGIRLIVAPGNHDFNDGGTYYSDAYATWKSIFGDPLNYVDIYVNSTHYVRIITINTTRAGTASGGISSSQLNYVESWVNEADNDPYAIGIYIVGHHPVGPNSDTENITRGDFGDYLLSLFNDIIAGDPWRLVRIIVNSKKTIAYICGHSHINLVKYLRGKWCITTSTLCRSGPWSGSYDGSGYCYRILVWDSGKFSCPYFRVGEWPVAIITNVQHGDVLSGLVEIRALIFYTASTVINEVKLYIDNIGFVADFKPLDVNAYGGIYSAILNVSELPDWQLRMRVYIRYNDTHEYYSFGKYFFARVSGGLLMSRSDLGMISFGYFDDCPLMFLYVYSRNYTSPVLPFALIGYPIGQAASYDYIRLKSFVVCGNRWYKYYNCIRFYMGSARELTRSEEDSNKLNVMLDLIAGIYLKDSDTDGDGDSSDDSLAIIAWRQNDSTWGYYTSDDIFYSFTFYERYWLQTTFYPTYFKCEAWKYADNIVYSRDANYNTSDFDYDDIHYAVCISRGIPLSTGGWMTHMGVIYFEVDLGGSIHKFNMVPNIIGYPTRAEIVNVSMNSSTAKVIAKLSFYENNSPISGETLILEASTDGINWFELSQATTNDTGYAVFIVSKYKYYRVRLKIEYDPAYLMNCFDTPYAPSISEVWCDVTPPNFTITYSSIANNTWFNNRNIVIKWNVWDSGVGVDRIDIFINSTYVGSVSGYEYSIDLNDGWWNITLVALDMLGNANVSKLFIGVDTEVPQVTIISPQNMSNITNGSILLRWSAKDNVSGITRVEIYLDSVLVALFDETNITNSYELELSLDKRYSVDVKVYDKANNMASDRIYVTKDQTSPSVRIMFPSEDEYITNESTIKIEWNATDTATGVKFIRIHLSGALVALFDTSNMTNSCIIQLNYDGEYVIEVESEDWVGNIGRDSLIIRRDSSPPQVNILNPDRLNTSSDKITLRWEVYDAGTGVKKVEILVNNEIIAVYISENMTYQHDLLLGLDGTYVITVKAYDWLDQSSEDSIVVTKDSKAPTISIESPRNYTATNNFTIIIKWNAYDNLGGTGIRVIEILRNSTKIAEIPPSEDSYIVELPAEAYYNITIIVFDWVDNNDSCSVIVVRDLTSPEVKILSPIDEYNTTSSQIMLIWNATDVMSEVILIEVYLNGKLILTSSSAYGEYLINITTDGRYMINVIAYDKAGNCGENSVTITRDTTPPSLIILNPQNNLNISSHELNISWYSNDELTGVIQVEIYINGSLIGTYGSSGNISVTLSVDGTYKIELKAIDALGNVRIKRVIVNVDTRKPTVRVTNPPNKYNTSSSKICLSWTCDDDGTGVQKVLIYRNSTLICSLVFGANMSQEYYLALPRDAVYLIEVVVYDWAGNKNSEKILVTRDTISPVISIITSENNYNTSEEEISIRWSANDNGTGIKFVELYLNSTRIAVFVSGLNMSNEYTISLEADTRYLIKVIAFDWALNNNSHLIKITKDSKKPMVTILNDDMIYCNNNSIVIKWIAVDNSTGVHIVEVYVNDTLLLKYVAGVNMSNNVCVSLNTDGLYEIRIHAFDWAGNSNYDEIRIYRDTIKPRVVVRYNHVINYDEVEIIEAIVYDNLGVDYVMINISINGSWFIDYMNKSENAWIYHLGPLEAGTLVCFYVIAIDLAENINASEQCEVRVVDKVPPEIHEILYEPTTPEYDENVTVKANVTDHSKLRVILHCLINGNIEAEIPMKYDNSSGLWIATIESQRAGTMIEFYVIAMDEWNNTIYSDKFTVLFVDNTPPEILDVDWKPKTPTVGDNITIMTIIEDHSEIIRVELLYCLGETWYNVSMKKVSTNLWNITISSNGARVIKFRIMAVDAWNNTIISDEYEITLKQRPQSSLAMTSIVLIIVSVISLIVYKRRRKRSLKTK